MEESEDDIINGSGPYSILFFKKNMEKNKAFNKRPTNLNFSKTTSEVDGLLKFRKLNFQENCDEGSKRSSMEVEESSNSLGISSPEFHYLTAGEVDNSNAELSLGLLDVELLDNLTSKNDEIFTKIEATPSPPEELPFDPTPVMKNFKVEEEEEEERKTKNNSTFITSITSITSLDTGYQGDGEMSRPGSRGAETFSNPISKPPSLRPQIMRKPDPMTDSDFYTESEADNPEENNPPQEPTTRRVQVIDGTLYGVDARTTADIYINNKENMDSSGIFTDGECNMSGNVGSIAEEVQCPGNVYVHNKENMDSSGIFTDGECNMGENVESVAEETQSPVESVKTVSEKSQRNAKSGTEKCQNQKKKIASNVALLKSNKSSGFSEKKDMKKLEKKPNKWDSVMSKISKKEEKPDYKNVKSKVFNAVGNKNKNNKMNSENIGKITTKSSIINNSNKKNLIQPATPPLTAKSQTRVVSSAQTSPPRKRRLKQLTHDKVDNILKNRTNTFDNKSTNTTIIERREIANNTEILSRDIDRIFNGSKSSVKQERRNNGTTTMTVNDDYNKDEMKRLKDAFEKEKREKNRLKNELEIMNIAQNNLEKVNTELRDSVRSLVDNVHKKQMELSELRGELDETREELEMKRSVLERQTDKFHRKFNKLEVECRNKEMIYCKEYNCLKVEFERLLQAKPDFSEKESLKSIIDMKREEIENLKKTLLKTNDELSKMKIYETKYNFLSTKVEQLEHQILKKSEREHQLLLENKRLEELLKDESNQKRRLMQFNEELQWKLRQNKEIIAKILTSESNKRENNSKRNTGFFINNKDSSVNNLIKTNKKSDDDDEEDEDDDDDDDDEVVLSPRVKSVVEKSESLSYVLDLNDDPQVVAERIIRRSFRQNSHQYHQSGKTNKSRNDCDKERKNPLSQSASSGAILTTTDKSSNMMENLYDEVKDLEEATLPMLPIDGDNAERLPSPQNSEDNF